MQMQAMQPFYLHQSEPSAEKGLFLSLRFPGKLLKSLFFCHLHFLFLYFSATLVYIIPVYPEAPVSLAPAVVLIFLLS